MRIALDGMGGDAAPAVVVEGAALAARELAGAAELVLVGQVDQMRPLLEKQDLGGGKVHLHPASQVATMEDAPGQVLRRMRDASIRVAFDLHKAGEVDAVISAGNSGATMAVGMFVMGRLPEVDRPALGTVFPGFPDPTVLVDVGANVDCTPLMLLQFGYMGAVYAEKVLGLPNPTVGLLSIGEEDSKGNSVVKQAHEYLKNSALAFIGNVEGRDLFNGPARVVVCDGFVGNVCLKLSEGLAKSLKELFVEAIRTSLQAKVGALLLKSALKGMAHKIDYASYGGAPLLGINGVAFVCHGASSAKAIASAVRMAKRSVENRITEAVSEGLNRYRGKLLGLNGGGESAPGPLLAP